MLKEKKAAHLLLKHKKTITLAESCSGGLLCNRLTNISGSSNFLKAGIVTYSNAAKTKLLKVPSSLIKKYGAVSLSVAEKMAQGARKLFNTDYGIAITGIAGPTGGTKQKPVGLTFIALASRKKTTAMKFLFKGSRLKVKQQAADKALEMLLEFLK